MKLLVALLIIALAVWYFGFGGFLLKPIAGSHGLRDGTMHAYRQSEIAKWIAIPESSTHITTYRFLGFDTNYRFLKTTLGSASPDLTELCFQSIALQPRMTNSTFTIITNINLGGFSTAFGSLPKSVPPWWSTDGSRFDRSFACTWEDNNHYGYGYLYLHDTQAGELRVFQWSHQWNDVSATMNALAK